MQVRTVCFTIWIAILISSASLVNFIGEGEKELTILEGENDELSTSARSALSWSLSAGGFEYDEILDLVVADDGSTYVVGKFTTSLIFGDEGGIGATGMAYDVDFFVGKVATDNTWEWIIGGGSSTGEDVINTVDITPEGDIVVGGTFCMGTADTACQLELAGQPTISKGQDTSEGNAFVAKLNNNGTWLWVETFGSDYDESFIDLKVSSFGNIYFNVLFRGMMSIGPDTLVASESDFSMAYIRMDADRTWVFAKQMMGNGGIEPFGGICEAPGGKMYLVGTFLNQLLFDPDIVESEGGADIFVALMNTNGSYAWVKSAGGIGEDFAMGCDSNSVGDMTVVGSIDNSANFSNNITIIPSGWIDGFIATLDNNGTWLTAEAVGGSGWEELQDVTITNNDDALVIGRAGNSFTLGQITVSSSGGTDTLLAQRSTNGTWLWAITGGSSSGDDFGVAVGLRDSSPISANSFSGTASYSSSQNTSQGDTDFVIWGYAQDMDGDGITDGEDNCLQTANPDQSDLDLDGEGDACDDDKDGDGLQNNDDLCPIGQTGWYSSSQSDHDGDGCLDAAEDLDDDDDGILDTNDSCSKGPLGWVSNLTNDQDQDGCEDVDSDSDGLVDQQDNCPSTANPNQEDLDGDGIGDACENDTDGDGIDNGMDNCPTGLFGWVSEVANDLDGDGCKDAGEDNDDDGDGINDLSDDCPVGATGWISDAATDHDSDGCKDSIEDDDDDDDSINDAIDLCPLGVIGVSPLGQDLDNDGCNDLQEDDDKDNDGVTNSNDVCSGTALGSTVNSEGCSPSQRDTDGDGIKDVSDQCPNTPASTIVDSLGCETSSGTNTDGTSGSDPEDVEEGVNIVMIALIGMVLILVAGAGIVTWMGKQVPTNVSQMEKSYPGVQNISHSPNAQTSGVEGAASQGNSVSNSSTDGGQNEWTDEQLLAQGWTQEQINTRNNQ